MSFLAVGSVAAGIGAVGNIYGMVEGGKQKKAANAINPTYSNYEASPYAAQQLAAAQNAFNGRMAGAATEAQNIANAQANTNANAQRVASSGSQALALASAAQGKANDAYSNLGIQEAQNKQNMLSNLNQAYAVNIKEGDKVYDSQLTKYKLDLNRQSALAGAGAQNIQNGITGLGNVALGFGSFLGNL